MASFAWLSPLKLRWSRNGPAVHQAPTPTTPCGSRTICARAPWTTVWQRLDLTRRKSTITCTLVVCTRIQLGTKTASHALVVAWLGNLARKCTYWNFSLFGNNIEISVLIFFAQLLPCWMRFVLEPDEEHWLLCRWLDHHYRRYLRICMLAVHFQVPNAQQSQSFVVRRHWRHGWDGN